MLFGGNKRRRLSFPSLFISRKKVRLWQSGIVGTVYTLIHHTQMMFIFSHCLLVATNNAAYGLDVLGHWLHSNDRVMDTES